MRIVFTGGGTGGHLFPIVAVAREIKKIAQEQNAEWPEMIFIGPDNFGMDFLAQENIAVQPIISGKLRRYFSFLNFIDLFINVPLSFLQALWLLFKLMPDVIFSKGGHGSVAVVIVGWIFRIPIIIHESDSVPGLANKIASHFARRIAISFSEASKHFNVKKTALVGNPVRQELIIGSKDEAKKIFNILTPKPIVFIYGGSQGAQAINEVVMLDLPRLTLKYEIIHQCGEDNYGIMEIVLKQLFQQGIPQNYHLLPFLDERQMRDAYAACDIIVSRAGSGTIFEIAALGKPSILIPLQNSAAEHQLKNAFEYSRTGAALILEQENLTPHILMAEIDKIVNDKVLLLKMSNLALDFSKPDAARQIAVEILNLVAQK